MKRLLTILALGIILVSTASAEDVGVLKVKPLETKTFKYKSSVGQVFAIKVLRGPELPEGQRGFIFGWEKQDLFCEGKNCAIAGGYLLFCPKAGVITGEFQNLSKFDFEVALHRVECEGKETGTMRCPSKAILTSMCGR